MNKREMDQRLICNIYLVMVCYLFLGIFLLGILLCLILVGLNIIVSHFPCDSSINDNVIF